MRVCCCGFTAWLPSTDLVDGAASAFACDQASASLPVAARAMCHWSPRSPVVLSCAVCVCGTAPSAARWTRCEPCAPRAQPRAVRHRALTYTAALTLDVLLLLWQGDEVAQFLCDFLRTFNLRLVHMPTVRHRAHTHAYTSVQGAMTPH